MPWACNEHSRMHAELPGLERVRPRSRINAEPAGPQHVHPRGTKRAKIVAQGSAEVADADADAARSETGAGERVVHSLHTRLASDSPKGGWQQ